MLTHPTLDKLQHLRLSGMYQALREQLTMPDIDTLSFDERFGLLVDRELTDRDDRRLHTRLLKATLRQAASWPKTSTIAIPGASTRRSCCA